MIRINKEKPKKCKRTQNANIISL